MLSVNFMHFKCLVEAQRNILGDGSEKLSHASVRAELFHADFRSFPSFGGDCSKIFEARHLVAQGLCNVPLRYFV